jgi:hypothetical protein
MIPNPGIEKACIGRKIQGLRIGAAAYGIRAANLVDWVTASWELGRLV